MSQAMKISRVVMLFVAGIGMGFSIRGMMAIRTERKMADVYAINLREAIKKAAAVGYEEGRRDQGTGDEKVCHGWILESVNEVLAQRDDLWSRAIEGALQGKRVPIPNKQVFDLPRLREGLK